MTRVFTVRRDAHQTCTVLLDVGDLGPDPDDWEEAAASKAAQQGIWQTEAASEVRAYLEPQPARPAGAGR